MAKDVYKRQLQHDKPEDFVIATGEMHTVREFCTLAFREAGIELEWEGEGVEAVSYTHLDVYKRQDRNLFKEAMIRIGLDVPRSGIAHTCLLYTSRCV